MEDEGLLLSNQHLAPAAVTAWRAAGRRRGAHPRALVGDRARARRPPSAPSGFNAADPNDPRYSWANLDTAVAMVRDAGMRVMLTITGPGPLWTSSRAEQAQPALEAVDEGLRGLLARRRDALRDQVDRYLIWNEPNQQGWLQPQWECDSRRRNCKPVSPHLYRALVRAAVPQIHAADPGAEIVDG